MLRIAFFVSLATYAVVASQPLFYLVALGRAQRALSAPAYVELRQRVNPVMVRRVPAIYLSTLVALAALALVAWSAGDSLALVAAGVALLCLVADAILMTLASVPVNSVMDAWTVTEPPTDWEVHRDRWFAIFAWRELALLVGFAVLLAGAALH
jgi:hypothetical protein